MSEEDLKLCEIFIRDPTRNPLTGARMIKDKGPYNSYVKLCEKNGLSLVTSSQSNLDTANKTDDRTAVKSSTKAKTATNKTTTLSVKILAPITDTNLPNKTITLSTNRVFTGIPDTDLMILLNTNSLIDIIAIFNTSKYFRNLLNKQASWNILQQHFGIFQLNNFPELAILNRELEKTKIRHRVHKGKEIYDFRPGDRVVIKSVNPSSAHKRENYVVVNVKSPNITLQEVDIFGTPVSNNLILGTLKGRKRENVPWNWYYIGREGLNFNLCLAIAFGINNHAGFCIKTLDSPYLKYKTLPNMLQHGKPIEESYCISFPHGKDGDYYIKLEQIPCLMYRTALKVTTYKEFQLISDFKPEPGMLVEVIRESQLSTALTNIYYIDKIYDNKLLLKIVHELSPDCKYSDMSDTLIAVNKNDCWYEINSDQLLTLIFGSGIIHKYKKC
jgi:hypothetical protein